MISDQCHCNFLQTSFTHQVVKVNHRAIKNLLRWIQEHWKAYGSKHKIVFNRCCNCITTAYFDSKYGRHGLREAKGLFLELKMDTLNEDQLLEFLRDRALATDEVVVVPGINLNCGNYDIEEKLQIIQSYRAITRAERSEIVEAEGTIGKRQLLCTPQKCSIAKKLEFSSGEDVAKRKYGLKRDDMYNKKYIEEIKRRCSVQKKTEKKVIDESKTRIEE